MITVRKLAARSINNRHDFQNKESEATVYLYGDIGGYFGIDHLEWIKEFNDVDADTIHLRIDSSGGDIFAARAMKTAIMQHKAKVIAHIDGLAASAASFLAMGADEVEIVDGGFLMIHNALSFLDVFGYFNAKDLDDLIVDISKERDLHEKINESIANDYAKATGIEVDKFLAWMNDETWFTAAEAVENKLADRIYDGQPVDGHYDLSRFANTPNQVKERNQKVTKRTIEKALRDVGLTNKEAKKVIAEGFDDKVRDEPEPDKPIVDTSEPQPVEDPIRDDEDKPKDRVTQLLIKAETFAPSHS